jgi:glutaredoxin 3
MPKIEIYTTSWCPYCHRAKALLDQKGAKYEEIDAENPAVRSAMSRRAGGRHTVPQIFIDGKHIGGCDDLHALDDEGGLDPLLEARG